MLVLALSQTCRCLCLPGAGRFLASRRAFFNCSTTPPWTVLYLKERGLAGVSWCASLQLVDHVPERRWLTGLGVLLQDNTRVFFAMHDALGLSSSDSTVTPDTMSTMCAQVRGF